MGREAIQKTVLSFVGECGDIRSNNYELSLFSADFGFQACDMAHVLIGIHKSYCIPMEKLVQALEMYSINELVRCIEEAQKS